MHQADTEDHNTYELESDDSYEGRCGEIFITEKRYLIFHCTFCDDVKYDNFKIFLQHLTQLHYNNIEDEEILPVPFEEKQEMLDDDDQMDIKDEYEELECIEYCQKYDTQPEEEYEAPENEKIKSELSEYENTESEADLIVGETLEITPLEISDATPIAASKNNEQDSYHSTKPHNVENLTESDEQHLTPECASDVISVYTCRVCETKFFKKQSYTAHLRSHNTERKYKCEHCGFAFKERYNLRAHLRRHTEKKQFTCTQCSKSFFTRNELDIHIRRHTGERPFMCAECGLGFVSSGSLNEHTKRHTNYRPHKCQKCEKSFFDTHLLKEHQIVHTQERKFQCTICNTAFSRRKALAVHQKLHENKREYVCMICGFSYNQRQALCMHMKNKHGAPKKKPKTMDVITCEHCFLEFFDLTELLEHEQKVHAITDV